MEKRKLILIGGGGHCRSCIDVIESANMFEIEGILDVKDKVGMHVSGYRVIGTDSDIDSFSGETYSFLVTLGQIKNALLRKRIYERLRLANKRLATVISSTALVSKHSVIGEGSIIMHGAKVNAGAHIGENCIINTSANIEHDATIGNHVHVSTGAVVNGDCRIGDDAFIGSNSVLVNGVEIAPGIVIGAGAVVIRSITEPGIYVGNPCRKVK